MDDVTWGGLAAALTLLGAVYTWWAFTRRGVAAGARGLGLTLLPAAAWLTGTLRMFTRIADAISDWALALVFSPKVWTGITLAGLSVVLWVVGGFLHGRNARRAGDTAPGAVTEPGRPAAALPKTSARKNEPPLDDDLADIEAILKKRGIS